MRSAKIDFIRADVLEADFARLLAGIDVLFHLAFIVAPTAQAGTISPIGSTSRVAGGSSRERYRPGTEDNLYQLDRRIRMHRDNPELLDETSPLPAERGHVLTPGRRAGREAPGPAFMRAIRACHHSLQTFDLPRPDHQQQAGRDGESSVHNGHR